MIEDKNKLESDILKLLSIFNAKYPGLLIKNINLVYKNIERNKKGNIINNELYKQQIEELKQYLKEQSKKMEFMDYKNEVQQYTRDTRYITYQEILKKIEEWDK